MALTLTLSLSAQTFPWQDKSLSFHERARLLVKELTLEEKVSQMGNMVDVQVKRDGVVILPMYQYWNEALHGVARSGAATSFPESKGMSSSWDRQLIYDCAWAISDEARVYNNLYNKNLNYWCPTINMARDPRWGRDEENYGEDPFLAGSLAVQFIKGMQGEQTEANPYYKTIACAKHFAANNYEQGRQGSTSFMTEHVLREYYLPAFEMSVKEGGVMSIMSSYNALSTNLDEKNAAGIGWSSSKAWGGKPNAMNDWLLTSILRDEWGFKGYVTSDCAGVSCIFRPNKHRYFGNFDENDETVRAEYAARATGLAIKAGNDMNCEFKNRLSEFQTAAEKAIADGWMTEEDLDRALIRVLETRFALGEFDDDVAWKNVPADRLECEEHQALALKAAQESIVLLKNDIPEGGTTPLLPLSKDKKVALIGPYANQIMLGDYSGTPTYTTTPFQAVAAKYDFKATDGTIQAEDFSEVISGDAAKMNQGKGYLENTAPGNEVLYKNVDFGTGCTDFVMAAATKNTGVATVSFYLDSDTSEPILTVSNVEGKTWTDWKTVEGKVDASVVKGVHDLYVKFSGTQKYAGNYDFFRFYNPDYNPLEEQGPVYVYAPVTSVNTKATDAEIARAAQIAQKADVVVFLGGTNFEKPDDHATGTESHDRFIITLPGNQEEMLKAIREVNPNVVLVLETNSSMDINWEKENIPAILDAWYGGQAQGQAICDVLYGDYNPGGKLTSTWYNSLKELPAADDSQFKANGMLEYNIDEWGYTYMYYGKGKGGNVSRQATKPMYPFGYGMSYTTFSYSNLQLSALKLGKDDTMTVKADIKNTGSKKGAEVVQLYVSFPGSKVSHRPVRKLVGFDRVELEPGETKTVTMQLSHEQLAYFNDDTHNFETEEGTVNLYVSASSADDRLTGSINTEAAVVKKTYLSESTGIDGMKTADQKLKSGTVYNLNGSAMGSIDNLDAMPKGLYIINGSKYIKRFY